MKIGVFDSGRGGTTVLAAVKALLPDEEYFYIADSKNCPYGEKSDEELYKIVTKNVNDLKSWGAKIIIIACNTATVKCIKKLRTEFNDLKFVGTEPAIKLAANQKNAKNILVLATPGTIKSERTINLKNLNQKPGQHIDLLACPGLADAIEREDDNIDKFLDTILPNPQDRAKYDVVVLGCTHYPLIKDELVKKFPSAILLDGGEGVAKQVKKLISS